MLRLTSKGDYNSTRNWLKKTSSGGAFANLDRFGKAGVDALAKATPVDTGKTAASWRYRIVKSKTRPSIEWYNTNVEDGEQVVILLQYGHGTGTGGWVRGRDFINPAMRPVFDQIATEFWKEVTSWRK